MEKKKNNIYSSDWLQLHPYQNSARTDLYYTQIANRILHRIAPLFDSTDEDFLTLSESEQKELSCMLAAYFEDAISQTGMFRAFRQLHRARYGTPVPFFPIGNEYADEEINKEDVQFLVWHYFMQLNNLEIPLPPALTLFGKIAESVMEILDEEYETAPENEKMQEYFRFTDKEAANLHLLHSKFFWLGTQSYLFANNGLILQEEAESLAEQAKNDNMEEQIPDIVNLLCNDFGYNNTTELFALSPAQWLAEIVGEDSPAYAPLRSIGQKYTGYFRFEMQDGGKPGFRHIATDRAFTVNPQSLNGFPKEMKENGVILYTGLVEFNGEWWLTGQTRSYEENEELLDEISASNDGYELFEPETELPDEEQEAILADLLANDTADEESEYSHPTWNALLCDELGKKFLYRQIEKQQLPALAPVQQTDFPLNENLKFILDYIKR